MSRNPTSKLPAVLAGILLIGVPASGCAAHSHHRHRTVVTYQVHKAPPAPRREVVVVKPSRDAVWVPGHYVWRSASRSYAWVAGRWTKPPRRGAVWVKPRTEKRRGQLIYIAGYWK